MNEAPKPNKLQHPVITASVIGGLILNVVAGTTFAIRMEGAIDLNQNRIQHVKELQDQQNEHVKDAIDEQKEDLKEIKKLVEQVLREKKE